MPANPKYLNKSPKQQASKIVAGILGGYLITSLIHMVLALVLPLHKEVLVTSIISSFLIWGTLLIIPFLFKNGFKVLGIYTVIIILLGVCYFFANQQNPFV